MAKHIPFGKPINQAEAWAFNKLKEDLPDKDILLTNVEIPTKTGQAFEVDALVVGEWGVFVIDVKGYLGRLEAGLHAWTLDGHHVENSLSKANYVARVLAGNLRKRLPRGDHAPWCQGVVFVTGREGDKIELEKEQGDLSIYTPRRIVSALTNDWGTTAAYKHKLTEAQRRLVMDTIGQIRLVEQKNQRIQDFKKVNCLLKDGGVEIWSASYNLGGWRSDWILKILVQIDFESDEQYTRERQRITDQVRLMQELSNCSGVPLCSSLIDDGEQLVLPMRIPSGQPLSTLNPDSYPRNISAKILRRAATSLQQINEAGYTIGVWSAENIFVADAGDVQFVNIDNSGTTNEDLQRFASQFEPFARQINSPSVTLWFARAANGEWVTLDELRAELSVCLSQDEQEVGRELSEDMISPRYRLLEKLRESDNSEIWKAENVIGSFNVCISVFERVEASWLGLSEHYRRIKEVYHPNIERVIEFGQSADGRRMYLAKEWVEGKNLRELRASIDPEQARSWYKALSGALAYIHDFDIYHGGISLKNIVISNGIPKLVNFGMGLEAVGNEAFRQSIDVDSELWSLEADDQRDKFALIASFVLALRAGEFPEHINLSVLLDSIAALPPAFLGEDLEEELIEGLSYLDV